MVSPRLALLGALLLIVPQLRAASKPHVVALGALRREPYSAAGDPAGARPGESALPVRPLVVDGKVKEWTTGEVHEVTERSFTVRRAVRLNDALPTDRAPRWVWQRGPWLLVDRLSGKVSALHLPDFDPAVSEAVWFRDDAAYCGVSSSGKRLLAVVAQVEGRRPLLAKNLGPWDPADHPAPVCAPAVWQREPLQVTFQPAGAAAVNYALVGTSSVLVEDGDDTD